MQQPNLYRVVAAEEETNRVRGAEPRAANSGGPAVPVRQPGHPQGVLLPQNFSLKLSNLFLTSDMQVKVGDFGLAAKLDANTKRRTTVCGTPNYIAPEVLEGRRGYSFQVDIWSFGVILYSLLIGELPFDGNTDNDIYTRIRRNSYRFPKDAKISEDAKDLITRIFCLSPERRISLEEVHSHPFLADKHTIPKVLPVSTLHKAPSKSYIKEQMQILSAAKQPEIAKLPIADSEACQLVSEWKKNASRQTIDSPKSETLVYIKKWINCSAKYGIGYILSNGLVGVLFNDSTKIVLSHHNQFDYIERSKADKKEYIKNYILGEHPAELKKKVTLLKRAKEQLERNEEVFASPNDLDTAAIVDKAIYLKKWASTSNGIVFRLSNKIIQANFYDNTELIINPETHEVSYIDRKGERIICPSCAAMKSQNAEIIKKLQHTKHILQQLTSINK